MIELRERAASGDPQAVVEVIDALDRGTLRVAEKVDGVWIVHAWVKEAILAYFKLRTIEHVEVGPFHFYDKIPLKQHAPGVRVVPPGVIRHGAHVEPGAIVMPGYVNIGARVGVGPWWTPGPRWGAARRLGGTCTCRAGWASAASSNRPVRVR